MRSIKNNKIKKKSIKNIKKGGSNEDINTKINKELTKFNKSFINKDKKSFKKLIEEIREIKKNPDLQKILKKILSFQKIQYLQEIIKKNYLENKFNKLIEFCKEEKIDLHNLIPYEGVSTEEHSVIGGGQSGHSSTQQDIVSFFLGLVVIAISRAITVNENNLDGWGRMALPEGTTVMGLFPIPIVYTSEGHVDLISTIINMFLPNRPSFFRRRHTNEDL